MSSVMKTIYFKCFVKLNGCFRWNSKSSPCDSVLARSFLWLSLVYILRSGLKLGGQIALICDIILTTTTRAKGLEFHSCFSGHLSVILITSKNWLLGFLIVLYINIYVNIWYSFYLLFLRPVLIKCWMWLIIDRYLLGIHVILWLS